MGATYVKFYQNHRFLPIGIKFRGQMIIKGGQKLRRSDSWVAVVRSSETGSGVVGADYGAH